MPPAKFLEHVVVLCFERRYPKRNSVIRLKSNSLPPIFGLATSLFVTAHEADDTTLLSVKRSYGGFPACERARRQDFAAGVCL